MSHHTKSGWKSRRHKVKQRLKRRQKRQRAALLEAGYIRKGQAPAASTAG